MSAYFEWFIALKLKPETPEAFQDELAWHTGLREEPPVSDQLYWGASPPLLADRGLCERLPGGHLAVLAPPQAGSAAVDFVLRTLIKEDGFGHLMKRFPQWLARWSQTQGWIGYAREEGDLDLACTFFVQAGFAYIAPPGKAPSGVDPSAPAFTLTGTMQ